MSTIEILDLFIDEANIQLHGTNEPWTDLLGCSQEEMRSRASKMAKEILINEIKKQGEKIAEKLEAHKAAQKAAQKTAQETAQRLAQEKVRKSVMIANKRVGEKKKRTIESSNKQPDMKRKKIEKKVSKQATLPRRGRITVVDGEQKIEDRINYDEALKRAKGLIK